MTKRTIPSASSENPCSQGFSIVPKGNAVIYQRQLGRTRVAWTSHSKTVSGLDDK